MTGGPSRFVIEPLNRLRHDRATFTCGVVRVDNFLARTAAKQMDADVARVFVILAGGSTARDARRPMIPVLGFYALNAHEIAYQMLPPEYAKQRPSHRAKPSAFIRMIGVDKSLQGQEPGERLLMDALARIVRTSDEIGLSVVRLDVLDDGDLVAMRRRKALYETFGFLPLPSNEWMLFMPIETARQTVGRI